MTKKLDFSDIKSSLLSHILKTFYARKDFTYEDFTGAYLFESKGFIQIYKPIWKETYTTVQVTVLPVGNAESRKHGIEVKIEYLLSNNMWEAVFEGWIESVDSFHVITKAIGLFKI